jgi:hypothetical protein
MQTVLRIRDVYPGSDFFPYRIRIISKYFNPKNGFLSFRKYDLGCSSRIRIMTFYPFRIPDPESRGQKGNGSQIPDPQHCMQSIQKCNHPPPPPPVYIVYSLYLLVSLIVDLHQPVSP